MYICLYLCEHASKNVCCYNYRSVAKIKETVTKKLSFKWASETLCKNLVKKIQLSWKDSFNTSKLIGEN